jgi:pimeloyl-ACP methyl ester carboxylesterase
LQVGSGKDLLLLHGYMASKESFYPQIAYFSRFYRVTALDFPGFGENTPLSVPYSVSDYSDWTEETIQKLHLEFPHLIAHSFGGRVAIKCLSRGEMFDRVVLCGCAGIIPKRTTGYLIRVKTYRTIRKMFPRFAENHFGSEEYRMLSPVMKESYKKIVNEDLREDATHITRPVLFIYGENDRETPLSSAQIYHERVRNSRLLILKGCGHFAHLDNAVAFNLATEEFLQWT